jgi:hypothetical protein
MRIRLDDLRDFERSVGPAPPPIEPRLPAREEAALIAKGGSDPTVAKRRARVVKLLRRPATPEGADAELVALLAHKHALPLDRREDRLDARQQLFGIGSLKEPPPEVRALCDRLRVKPGDGKAFADALLPPKHDIGTMRESGAGFLNPG